LEIGDWRLEIGDWGLGGEIRRAATSVLVASRFRDLLAYRRAMELAHEVHAAVEHWPLLDRKTLGEQLIRAATSVDANIAEASGRWHERDRRQLLFIARGSLREAEHWIAYSEQRGLLARGTADRIDEIARLLDGLIKKAPPISNPQSPI
jgi:four helix bundle protein